MTRVDRSEHIIKNNTWLRSDKNFENDLIIDQTQRVEEIYSIINDEKTIITNTEKILIEDPKKIIEILLTISTFSQEYFFRTILIVINNPEMFSNYRTEEWIDGLRPSMSSIISKCSNNYFRLLILDIFFKAHELPIINRLPSSELNKLKLENYVLDNEKIVIQKLLGIKNKGASNANAQNNAENLINQALDDENITYEKGKLPKLVENAPDKARDMDWVIPSLDNPKIIVESSFVVTTASSMGDKAKVENEQADLISIHYPDAIFLGFVDGAGWVERISDLRRITKAFYDVFTFSESEINRFIVLIKSYI